MTTDPQAQMTATIMAAAQSLGPAGLITQVAGSVKWRTTKDIHGQLYQLTVNLN